MRRLLRRALHEGADLFPPGIPRVFAAWAIVGAPVAGVWPDYALIIAGMPALLFCGWLAWVAIFGVAVAWLGRRF